MTGRNFGLAQPPGVQRLTVRSFNAQPQTLLDIAGTWNDALKTPTAIKLNMTDTASNASSLLLDLQVGGVSKFKVDKTGAVTSGADVNIGAGVFRSSSGFNAGGGGVVIDPNVVKWSGDTILNRDAANTLAQRNAANAQAFNIYNTYTDASNFEKGFIRWSSGVLQIGVQVAGTGTSRAMSLFTNATARWTIDTFGAFMAAIDNTYDLGGSGVTRPRNGYFAGFISYAKQILTKTADYTVVSAETGCIYTNSGAAGQIIFTLPTWAAGLFYMFDVETAQNLRVVAPGTDTIRIAGSVSAGGGRIDNATIGGMIMIAATLSGKWLALFQEGTWTVT